MSYGSLYRMIATCHTPMTPKLNYYEKCKLCNFLMKLYNTTLYKTNHLYFIIYSILIYNNNTKTLDFAYPIW